MTPIVLAALALIGPFQSGGLLARKVTPLHPHALQRLCESPIQSVTASPYGGTAIKFMLDLGHHRQAVFKPRQERYTARYEAEIAAYLLAGHLGLHLVPPACERRIPWASLEAAVAGPVHATIRERLRREVHSDADGAVPGATLLWVRGAKELDLASNSGWRTWLIPGGAIPKDQERLAGDIADLLLLDLLFNNADRWSGGNILYTPHAMRLHMIDNGAAFRPVHRFVHPYHADALLTLLRVRFATYFRVKGLQRKAVAKVLRRSGEPASHLTAAEVTALLARRDALVRHIEGLRLIFGDARVFLP